MQKFVTQANVRIYGGELTTEQYGVIIDSVLKDDDSTQVDIIESFYTTEILVFYQEDVLYHDAIALKIIQQDEECFIEVDSKHIFLEDADTKEYGDNVVKMKTLH